ncbi:MAG TPA: HEAT repeat domain-containing protein [Polyangiaceae bacterium]|nr:HEAT repeat domain-containing protein [Polyangiaceae bacterium]
MRQVVYLLERARERWKAPAQDFAGQAQRFGAQAWRRVLARWPTLDVLLDPGLSSAQSPVGAPSSPPVRAAASAPPGPVSIPAEIEEALTLLRSSDSWQERVLAANQLAAFEHERVVSALLDALKDPSAEVAVAVVDALSAQQDRRALRALLDVLANRVGFYSPVTRVAALSNLARRLPKSELEPVLAALRDVDAEVSIAAIASISELLGRDAQQHLLPIVLNEHGFFLPVVRLAAANALSFGNALGPELSSHLLQSEQDPSVRAVLERSAAE